jgi:glycerol-3-phosphate dehydrogenase
VESRERALERLREERFDLLVVGGGIVGAGVAALAASHGLAVALLDRADFASGTSSASSKLIHGGLRYLRMGDFRLVREGLQEARALSASLAPHLVRPRRFLLPVYADGPYGRAAIGSALWMYRAFSGDHTQIRVAPEQAQALVPSLRTDGLRGGGLYSDAQTNDARLCLANIRAASDRGAVVLNYAEVTGIERVASRGFAVHVLDPVAGLEESVSTRAVVNAGGPWVDEIRRLEDSNAGTSVLLSKGVHLVLPKPERWGAAVTIPVDRSRVSFALPWEGVLLLGTTDDVFSGSPSSVTVDENDMRQILDEAARALVSDVVRREVLAEFVGLRVLPLGRRGTASARRETLISRGPTGMVSVAGGKLTTYRRIAVAVLAELRSELGLRGLRPAEAPLPGATAPGLLRDALLRDYPDVDAGTATTLVRAYGSLARDVLAYAREGAGALDPLAPGAPELVAQAWYARDREWALTAEDVLRRRTTLALRGFDSPELRARVDALLAVGNP